MNIQSYFYNCSWEYIDSIEPTFSSQIKDLFKKMPEAQDDNVLISNVFWMLASNGWSFSELPESISNDPPSGLKVNFKLSEIKKQNSFDLCAATLKPETPKHNDCIFRTIPAADSGRSRPPIPIDSGHRFRRKPATPLIKN